jgi:hypothetical protein
MSEKRVIVHSRAGQGAVCADDWGSIVLLTTQMDGEPETQIDLAPSEARRLGEWLIERANQAGER